MEVIDKKNISSKFVEHDNMVKNTGNISSNIGKINKGVVKNCEKLNVRKGPSKSSKILRILNKGDVVNINKLEGKFYKIKIGNIVGYCMKDYIGVYNDEHNR